MAMLSLVSVVCNDTSRGWRSGRRMVQENGEHAEQNEEPYGEQGKAEDVGGGR